MKFIYFGKYCRFLPIVQGLTSYWYDTERGLFVRNSLSRNAHLLINILELALLFHIVVKYLMFISGDDLLHPLLVLMLTFNYQLLTILAIYTIGHIWCKDRSYIQLKLKILKLENSCDEKLPVCRKIDFKLQLLLRLKYFLLGYSCLGVLVTNAIAYADRLNIWTVILIAFYTNVISLYHFVLFQYFELNWKLCRKFYQLEEYVAVLSRTSNRQEERNLSKEIHWISKVQLCSKLGELQRIFKWHIFFSRFYIIFANILTVYTNFVLADQIKKSLLLSGTFIFGYFLNALYLYITDFVCDMISQSFKELEASLKEFNETSGRRGPLEKQVC